MTTVSEAIKGLQEAEDLSATVVADVVIATGDFTGGASEDLFTATAHGMSNGQELVLAAQSAAGVVTGAVGDTFYVIDSATNTFRVALTAGGAVVQNTADGTAVFQKADGVDLANANASTFASDGPESSNTDPDPGYVLIG